LKDAKSRTTVRRAASDSANPETVVVHMDSEITWLSTADAATRLGITPRTLYRFIDEGQLPAYRFGRVIRLKEDEVTAFIDSCRIEPGTLEHLYPETGHEPGASETSATEATGT
jgi:excisionase family DNA binding protein